MAYSFISSIAAFFKARHDLSLLSAMDDQMLADIGLTNGDVMIAKRAGLFQNPTKTLAACVETRSALRLDADDVETVDDAPSLSSHPTSGAPTSLATSVSTVGLHYIASPSVL